jgi:signal transduction histidine kinase
LITIMAFASTEFIALCQSQVVLLTQALGAHSTVVYLAEQADNAMGLSLVPLVAYPETDNPWAGLPDGLTPMTPPESTVWISTETAPTEIDHPPVTPAVPNGNLATKEAEADHNSPKTTGAVPAVPLSDASSETAATPPLVHPLMHEGVALGMLVSHRPALAWSREDRQRAEQVANTLALAWILDQRGQWLQQQFQQRHLAQATQSETFHDLLHQFRNPLTALQTFGRLLVKRIPADDPNQPIAEGIVRESRRLQDLAQTFDEVLAQGDDALQTDGPGPMRRGFFGPAAPQGGLLLPETATPESSSASEAPLPDSPRWGRSLQRVVGSWVDLVTPLLQSATAIAQERGLYLVEQLPKDRPGVWMDPKALAEVLSNLLDNALKYAPAGSVIWVVGGLSQVVEGQTFQGLAIGDTGQGIPLADQPHIFDRHFRGVQASGNIPGTGLGLAIAKELMEGMGGHLDLISPVPPDYQRALSELMDQTVSHQGPGVCFIAWLAQV